MPDKVDTEAALDEVKKGLGQARSRADEARAARDKLKAEAERLAADAATHEQDLEKTRTELAELRARLEKDKAREGKVRESFQKAEATLGNAARDAKEAEARVEDLRSRVRDELSIELEDIPPPPPPQPGAPPFSETECEQEVGALRRQLSAIGDVNLQALQDCERLSQRKLALEEQTTDLAKAEENLRQTIRRLNDTSRQKFTETFEEVRKHFHDTFRKLFGGGKADLTLEAGVDILEAGVDILAKPPGKEARQISLLSGGEKVLATVALLFAVFRAKPGPFCILDEVDAALDEHNVGRFVALVRDYLDKSQFLIVTHNKQTMAAADALYGVTMPEPGVSTPVSVRLNVDKAAAIAGVDPQRARSRGPAAGSHGSTSPHAPSPSA